MCYHTTVLALQRAACRIAWIGKEWFLGQGTLFVQTVKGCPGHQHLASDFKLIRVVCPLCQLQGYALDGAYVLGDIVALDSVASRYRLIEFAFPIMKADAEAVELQFAAYLERCALQPFADTFVELLHFLSVVGVGQAEHGTAVKHRLELVVQVASHTLRGAVGVEYFGVCVLQILQFP